MTYEILKIEKFPPKADLFNGNLEEKEIDCVIKGNVLCKENDQEIELIWAFGLVGRIIVLQKNNQPLEGRLKEIFGKGIEVKKYSETSI